MVLGLLGAPALIAAASGWLGAEGARHPQDGPDADVRIRIDDEAVQFQIIMNLAFVDAIVDVPRESRSTLHPVEEQPLREALVEYYAEHNRVVVDGIEVTPLDAGFDVTGPQLNLLPLFPRMGTRALIRLRIVLDYPVTSTPRTVGMTWEPFPPDIVAATMEGTPPLEIRAQLSAPGGVNELAVFTKPEPEYIWHAPSGPAAERFLPVPEAPGAAPTIALPLLPLLIGLGFLVACMAAWARPAAANQRRALWFLAPLIAGGAFLLRDVWTVDVDDPFGGGRGLPSESEALAIFTPLHANIYRAFEYVDESDVYDALARSVDGELLDDLYNEIYRSLIMQEEGGAVSRVSAVRPVAMEVESIGLLPPDETAGFNVVTRWQVDGQVLHWGHGHSRTNEYQARYTIMQREAGWRIATHQVLEQFRVSAAPIDWPDPTQPPTGPPPWPEERPSLEELVPPGSDL